MSGSQALNNIGSFGFRGEGLCIKAGFHGRRAPPRLVPLLTPHTGFLAALASAASLCCLEITSKTSRERDNYSVIIKVSAFAAPPMFTCLLTSEVGW